MVLLLCLQEEGDDLPIEYKVRGYKEGLADLSSSIDTSALRKGKRFKNLKSLAAAAGTPLPTGRVTSKQYQDMYTIWRQYFEWRQIPNSYEIVITKIYNKPRVNKKHVVNTKQESKTEPETETINILSSSRSVYQNEVCKLLIHYLQKDQILKCTYSKLMDMLGMKYNLIKNEDFADNALLDKRISDGSKLYKGYKRALERSLNYLDKKRIITLNEIYIIEEKDGNKREMNSEEINYYKYVKRSAYLNGRRIMKDTIKKTIQEETTWINAYDYLEIKLIDPEYYNECYLLSFEELNKTKNELFQKFCNRLISNL